MRSQMYGFAHHGRLGPWGAILEARTMMDLHSWSMCFESPIDSMDKYQVDHYVIRRIVHGGETNWTLGARLLIRPVRNGISAVEGPGNKILSGGDRRKGFASLFIF